jgi:hypothetical protein
MSCGCPLVYALLDGYDLMTRRHLEAALAVWGYCLESARRVFGDALGDPAGPGDVGPQAGLRQLREHRARCRPHR